MNLRAQNLSVFLQLAQGVDEKTWLHHLKQGDYSRWFLDAIKDDELADAAAEIEAQAEAGAQTTRERMKALVTAATRSPRRDSCTGCAAGRHAHAMREGDMRQATIAAPAAARGQFLRRSYKLRTGRCQKCLRMARGARPDRPGRGVPCGQRVGSKR